MVVEKTEQLIVQTITWSMIVKIWRQYRWPDIDRQRFRARYTINGQHDFEISRYAVICWGLWRNTILVAVASGHQTERDAYRIRGYTSIPVSDEGSNASQRLAAMLPSIEQYARIRGATKIWDASDESQQRAVILQSLGFAKGAKFFGGRAHPKMDSSETFVYWKSLI